MKLLNVVEASDVLAMTATLPNLPAVYIWFRKLALDPSSSASFMSSIENTLRNDNWPFPLEGEGKIRPYDATLILKPSLHEFSISKRNIASVIAGDPVQRGEFAQLVLEASLMQPPLYVGKANDLGARIDQHLAFDTAFSKKIKSSKLSIAELVIAYLPLHVLPPRTNELLEGLIGYTAMPYYAGRIG